MAKPIYGGWVTFTSHMAHKYDCDLYKVGKRSEKNKRDYGYGVGYQNLRIDDILKQENILITAVDKHYWRYLDLFPKGTKVVIHDPTELKGKENKLRELLDNFEVITIRESVKDFLLEKFNKESIFLPHPFFEYKKDIAEEKCNYYSLCISRIDFDKNIDILLRANKLLDAQKKIYLFGAENRLYVHHKLKDMDFDKYWMGKYPKNLPLVYEDRDLLDNCAFVVDMSIIVGDGGGTQYTFLEAIYHECVLILHKDWVEKGDLFKNGVNCYVVGYTDNIEEEISNIITRGLNSECKKIISNANKLLKIHKQDLWKDIFS
jgi:glycosyltransferase involved in cell wall biosynthesis|tara:strand:+ start:154 stop:1107 length:954 start_codon:yes stop_codon:yes gene_type:complete